MLHILRNDRCLLQFRKVDEWDGFASLVERLAAGFHEISRELQEPAIATATIGFLVSAKRLLSENDKRLLQVPGAALQWSRQDRDPDPVAVLVVGLSIDSNRFRIVAGAVNHGDTSDKLVHDKSPAG
jgi:hypothetical protein